MKFKILFAFIFIAFFGGSQSVADFFNPGSSTVFVGLDFSKAKMIGTNGFTEPEKIVSYYYERWNTLISSEREKYNLSAAFRKADIVYNIGIVSAVNKGLSSDSLVSNINYRNFSESELQSMISKYDVSNCNQKYGVSFIVHSFNKLEERAKIYVVIFDIETKTIVFNKLMSPQPAGFGFRNYWAGSIYDLLKKIKKQSKKWY